MIPYDIWRDQANFTAEVRARAEPQGWDNSHLGKVARTKELMLHLISECSEVLDACGTWKAHVPKTETVNPAQLAQELIDVQKYWIMLCQLWNIGPEQLEEAYWAKSAAVRQRYAEMWIAQLDRPIVVVDLDNVLADFTRGFCLYLKQNWSSLSHATIDDAVAQHQWLSASTLGISLMEWAEIKHAFRVSSGFATLPPMPGAAAFLDRARAAGYAVIGLTSRPIDRYPNIYVDTVQWLWHHDMQLDHIWWGVDKADRLREASERHPGLIEKIVCAVDDDERFVRQFAELGVRTYWLTPTCPTAPPVNVQWVGDLGSIPLPRVTP